VPRGRPNGEDALNASFEPASRILSGFDAAAPSSDWHIGDQILFGLRIDDGKRQTTRFILIELKSHVLPPNTDVIVGPAEAAPKPEDAPNGTVYVPLSQDDPVELRGRLPGRKWSLHMTFTDKNGNERHVDRHSDPIFIAIHVYNENAEKITCSGTLAPEAYLRRSLYSACVAAMERTKQPLDAQPTPNSMTSCHRCTDLDKQLLILPACRKSSGQSCRRPPYGRC
jgi:hypothetical protein